MGEFVITRKDDNTAIPKSIGIKRKDDNPIRHSEVVTRAVESLELLRTFDTEHVFCIAVTKKGDEYNFEYVEDITDISTEDYAIAFGKDFLHQARLNDCDGIILAHNHPNCEFYGPSDNDLNYTEGFERLCHSPFLDKSLNKKRLRLYDHIILCGNKYYSFWEHGRLHPEEDII